MKNYDNSKIIWKYDNKKIDMLCKINNMQSKDIQNTYLQGLIKLQTKKCTRSRSDNPKPHGISYKYFVNIKMKSENL